MMGGSCLFSNLQGLAAQCPFVITSSTTGVLPVPSASYTLKNHDKDGGWWCILSLQVVQPKPSLLHLLVSAAVHHQNQTPHIFRHSLREFHGLYAANKTQEIKKGVPDTKRSSLKYAGKSDPENVY
ncbi:hypothetical protein E2C01_025759 [Portunus trituberculatus]|uniref:Uncharacterized protein n=1 Tax=Portunus trituberculatus TaxID=210409 RepID=A0A5B7EGB1_PORTR|nr:hypothetical protein [Portunus trituberculatus]